MSPSQSTCPSLSQDSIHALCEDLESTRMKHEFVRTNINAVSQLIVPLPGFKTIEGRQHHESQASIDSRGCFKCKKTPERDVKVAPVNETSAIARGFVAVSKPGRSRREGTLKNFSRSHELRFSVESSLPRSCSENDRTVMPRRVCGFGRAPGRQN